ncbi:MAG TPA: hypothetical protein VMA83_03815 [Solirubrobacteraceae bacterium]|nr:hypothetical protein [Solirubrobacteraceae bacterium]
MAIPATASATPNVKFKATAVPIPGFKHTGNFFGAGAAVNAEYTITGTEYYGAPAPLEHVNFYLPQGSELHPKGFTTCSESLINHKLAARCPKASKAGPQGYVEGSVQFEKECPEGISGPECEAYEAHEKELVEKHEYHEWEKVREWYGPHPAAGKPFRSPIQGYYTSRGLEFVTIGQHPVELYIASAGSFKDLHGAGGHGPVFSGVVPLVESLPGAPYASVEAISVKTGSAYKKGRKTYYYGTVPKKCPKHYLPVKTELTFAAVEYEGTEIPRETVKKEYHAPCPRK